MKIVQAQKKQSKEIARLIMLAMDYDCCQFFVGPKHGLADFERLMTILVESEDSLYSYNHTYVALENNDVIGICVAYDGSEYGRLRKSFISLIKKMFDRDVDNLLDETQAGELYIDSLAVEEDYRHKGIATELIKTVIQNTNHHTIGLLVDENNPMAEHLYLSLGFHFVNPCFWGGHPMKHLQYKRN